MKGFHSFDYNLIMTDAHHTHISGLIYWGQQEMRSQCTVFESVAATKEEFCIGSTLHRGYYHPSPVYDLIVGNTKRGRLCRKLRVTPKLAHHYYFDSDEKLACIETLYHGKIAYIEYIKYHGPNVMGITVNCNGELSAVCQALYSDNRILRFAIAHCYRKENDYCCFDYHKEAYIYDASGLSECHFINLKPSSDYIIDETYQFERENGFLVAFSSEVNVLHPQQKYRITKKRKA